MYSIDILGYNRYTREPYKFSRTLPISLRLELKAGINAKMSLSVQRHFEGDLSNYLTALVSDQKFRSDEGGIKVLEPRRSCERVSLDKKSGGILA